MGETITIRTSASTDVIKVVEQGPQGPAGQGVPAGGTTGQVLRKASGTNYDTEWSSGGGGSVDLSSPDPIGDVVPNTGAFTTLSASGTATLSHIHGSLAGNLYLHVKNVSGGELARGTPVYIVGNVGDTDRIEVAAADFDNASKMPAVGLLEQTLANNGTGDAVIVGELTNANTGSYSLNQELFVGNNGALTTTRPTTGEVQSVGTVSRVHASTGVIVVNMQGRRSPNEAFASSPVETLYNITATSIGSPQQIDLSGPPFTEATEVRSVLNNNTGIVYVQIFLPIDAVSIVPKFRFYGQISGAGDVLKIQLIRDSVVVFPASGSGYEELNNGETLEVVWNGTAYGLTPNAPYMRRITLPNASGTLALEEPVDNVFRIVGSSDATKKVAFEVDGLTAATTRTLTVPNASGTISLEGHTHAASDITSGTFDNARINFAAPSAIGSTTSAAGTFTTLTGTTQIVGPQGSTVGSASSNAITLGAANTGFSISNTQLVAVKQGANVWYANNTGVFVVAAGMTGGAAIEQTGAPLSFSRNIALFPDANGELHQRSTTQAQSKIIYGTYTSGTNYQRLGIRSVRQTLSALSGASATTTGTFIPDGAVVVGVTTRVTTLLAGATGYTIGDGTDADRWGDITGTAVGTTSDNRDWTAATIECFTAGGNITLTAKTANFTAGAIEISVFYLAGEAD